MSKKVKVISYAGNSIRINIPELRVNRLFEKQGQSYLFDVDTLEEMFYYPSVEELFTKGLFYIDDKELRIKLGLEEETGAVSETVIAPISDTTILSSTGASCPHLEHVATQMPYAIFVAVCSFIGFIVGGFLLNAIAAWIAALIVFVLGLIVLPKLNFGKKEEH